MGLIVEARRDIFTAPFLEGENDKTGLNQYCRESHSNKWKRKMKKKPDLVLMLFIVFGMGVAVSALGQVLGNL